jgi:hypothetical protein
LPYDIIFAPAEDIVGVVDAILAKPVECSEDFISEFADISSIQASNALHMANQFGLTEKDNITGYYTSNSFLARLIVSSRDDNHKAALMRLVLEQYEPYITFKSRFSFSGSIDLACKQVKTLYSMPCGYKDIRNSIINIATYSKAMINDGASSYKLNQDEVSYIEILELALKFKANDDNALRTQLGDSVCGYLNTEKVFNPLSDAYSKIQYAEADPKATILYAGNAFESFLQQIADAHNVSLVGKSGIGQKSDALSSVISKKHRGMIQYICQIRNAADHGADPDEGGSIWDISNESAQMYPIVVASIIKNIVFRESGVRKV